jgi:phosphohistidine phosphatase
MTQRSLVLLRHAKAEHPDGMADIDRPLTARGHGDAAAAGAWIAHAGYSPDLVICSPAKRTRQTWHGAALGMAEAATSPAWVAGLPTEPTPPAGTAPTVNYATDLYDGSAPDLLEVVRAADPEVSTILLIGHNPAISELSALLDPSTGDPEGLRTCGLAVHWLGGTWKDYAPGAAARATCHTARG